MNIKRFYSIVLLACLTFSLFKVFQFKTNGFTISDDKDYPFDGYGMNYCLMKEDFE